MCHWTILRLCFWCATCCLPKIYAKNVLKLNLVISNGFLNKICYFFYKSHTWCSCSLKQNKKKPHISKYFTAHKQLNIWKEIEIDTKVINFTRRNKTSVRQFQDNKKITTKIKNQCWFDSILIWHYCIVPIENKKMCMPKQN